jgi:GH24 family phage-related lysozyme (muramidase)
MELNKEAIKIAEKIVKMFEGCNLIAYPDPESKLYKALSLHGMLAKYMKGDIRWKELGDNFKALDGAPWTCGWGETNGVTKDTVWTQQEADSKLSYRVGVVMKETLSACPRLASEGPERTAAVTSLVYNIGITEFKASTALKRIAANQDDLVPEAIQRFIYSRGKIVEGLRNRRKVEANLWSSVK